MPQGNLDRPEIVHQLDQRINKKPDYDSGWVALAQDTEDIISHALGGDEDQYLIDLQMNDVTSYGKGKSQSFFDDTNGMYWKNLNETTITIYNGAGSDYEEYRLRIWKNQYQ